MRLRTLLLVPLCYLAGCSPSGTGNVEEASQATRSVIAQSVQAQALDVSIKLPVTIRPKDVIELRAAVGGTLISLNYDKGDVVSPSSLPPAAWQEAREFIDAHVGQEPPTDAEVALRNLRHLQGLECFARIESTQLQESFWEAQENYDQAVRDLKRVEEYPQSTGAQLDQARTRRSMARANVSRVLAMINDTYICSPVEGVVIERLRHEGEHVHSGELIARVAVMRTLVADLEIPEAHRSAIEVGEEMRVDIGSVLDEKGESVTRTAKVALIDSVAHLQTHSFTVELHIDNQDRVLPAGIFGTVYVVIYSHPKALVVPLSALKLAGTSKTLYVAVGAEGKGTAKELRNIEIGHVGRDWVEIKGDALKPGMKVVVFGAQGLSDGDAIRWTEKDPYVMKADKGSAQ